MPVCLIWKHLLRMVSPRGQLNVVWPKSLKPPARILFCFSNQFLRLPLLCPCGHNLRASTFRILHLTQWSQHRKTSRAKHEGKRERWISPRLLLCRVWPALYEFSPTPPFSLPSPAYPLLVHGANRFPQCRTSLKRCCISCHSFFFFFFEFFNTGRVLCIRRRNMLLPSHGRKSHSPWTWCHFPGWKLPLHRATCAFTGLSLALRKCFSPDKVHGSQIKVNLEPKKRCCFFYIVLCLFSATWAFFGDYQ